MNYMKIHKMKLLQNKMKKKRRGDIQRMNETDRRGMRRQEEGEHKFILHFLDILGYGKDVVDFHVMSVHYHGI